MKAKNLLIAATMIVAGGASAQLIVGNDQSGTGTIWEVNVLDGTATALFSSATANSKPWGMAADDANGILYWNAGGQLHSAPYADLLAGTANPTAVGLTFNSAVTNFVGLGFNPTTGKLLGTRNVATESVYEIDPVTGVATILFAHPTTFDFGGLEYDASTGKLYGLSDTAPVGNVRGLYEIVDATTQIFLAGYPGAETDIDGLAVGNGKAYYVTDGPLTTQAFFYVYNIATGVQEATIPSVFTGSGTFSAAAWAPGLRPGARATVSGRVILNDYVASPAGRPITFQVIQGGNVVDTKTANLNALGEYTFQTTASGNVTISADGTRWLRKLSGPESLISGGTTTVGFTLKNGDTDGSGEVDAADIDLVIANFGATFPGSGPEDSDVDGSGEVDAADIDIVIANFGEVDE